MQLNTKLPFILCLISTTFVQGQVFEKINTPPIIEQFFKDLTFEVGFNKSKVFNTKKIKSFEGDRPNRTYKVNVKKEFHPITTNYSMSIGYPISKNHSITSQICKEYIRECTSWKYYH